MKYILKFTAVAIALLMSCENKTQSAQTRKADALVFPQGDKITNANFTGAAYLQMLIDADSLNSISVGNVTFEPGARSKWHLHPAGQILLAIDGVGYYQEKGKPKQILRKGDAIRCPSNVAHWHGASADTAFVQVAITGREKGAVVWMEEVTDEEYAN